MRGNRAEFTLVVVVLLTLVSCAFSTILSAQEDSGVRGVPASSAEAPRRGEAVLGIGSGEFEMTPPGSVRSDVAQVRGKRSETISSPASSDFPDVPDELVAEVSESPIVSVSAEEESSLPASVDETLASRSTPVSESVASEAGEDNIFDSNEPTSILAGGPDAWFHSDNGWFGREGLGTSLKTILLMSAFTIAPAILLMTTSYVRISIVLFLLRQALGAGQVPSNQIIATLSIFLTMLVMSPVGIDVYQNAIVPYSQGQTTQEEAFNVGQEPIRTFMWKQIERTGNVETIGLFTKYLPDVETPEYYEDVPWRALAPAFLLSELKTAFLIGFQIFLPFLVIDLVTSCVLVSTGMMMLPPAIVSLPFKLALFVLVDGWTLVVKSLLDSFA